MNSIVEGFEHVMMPLAGKISSNKYLLAMRDAFSMLLPFIIVGSFFGIIEWVVLDPWGTIMGADGLGLGQTFTGLDPKSDAYKASSFVGTMQMYQGLCNNVVTVGFGIFSFMLVAAFSYRLGGIWGGDKFSTALTALGAFIIVTPQQVVGKAGDKLGAFSLDYFGNKAVLTAIIVATVASWIFVKLSKKRKNPHQDAGYGAACRFAVVRRSRSGLRDADGLHDFLDDSLELPVHGQGSAQ